jgi:hypothetical protein
MSKNAKTGADVASAPKKGNKKVVAAVPVVKVPEVAAPVATTEPATTAAPVEEKRKPGRPKSKVVVEKTPGKRGRPVESDSVRQQRLAELEAKKAAGLLKRGRPKMDQAELEKRRAIRKAEKLAALKTLETSNKEIADAANTAIAAIGGAGAAE